MKITGAAVVMPVRDVEAALAFYTGVLGFLKEFQFGRYAGVERDGALIHLSAHGNPNTGTPGSGCVYLFCDEVDDYFREITAKGARVDGEPKDYPYGMRDFVAQDVDGNRVSFGKPCGPD